MKTVIVYKSKTGYTRTYANWLAEELQCGCVENIHLKPRDIPTCDTILYGGGMYAGGINGLEFIKKNLDAFSGKNLIVWATGLNPGRPEEMEAVWERHFPGKKREQVKTFYLRGGFDFSRLNGVDKLLMTFMKRKLEKEANPSEDVRGLLQACEEPVNFCSREQIIPIVEYVRSLKT